MKAKELAVAIIIVAILLSFLVPPSKPKIIVTISAADLSQVPLNVTLSGDTEKVTVAVLYASRSTTIAPATQPLQLQNPLLPPDRSPVHSVAMWR